MSGFVDSRDGLERMDYFKIFPLWFNAINGAEIGPVSSFMGIWHLLDPIYRLLMHSQRYEFQFSAGLKLELEARMR